MINHWIESVFLKRVLLALVAASTAAVTTHIVPDLTPVLSHFGLSLTISDPEKLRDSMTVLFVSLSQGIHEWIAVKYPKLGYYL